MTTEVNKPESDEGNSKHKFKNVFVVDSKEEILKQIKSVDRTRPIWLFYTGMNTQCPKMGKPFLKFRPYRDSIYKSAEFIKKFNIDLVDMFENSNEDTFSDLTNCFIMITANQIALTDLLYAVGVKPEGIIGYSAGEISAAYADGSLTHEEAILGAYFRGQCLKETKIIVGEVAIIGQLWEDIKDILPEDINYAGHMTKEITIVSGPIEAITNFVNERAAKGYFAKIPANTGVPFHSSFIKDSGEILRKYLQRVIKNPKMSSKLVSTSMKDVRRNVLVNGDYFVNNFTGPMYVYEGISEIPDDAILLEIGVEIYGIRRCIKFTKKHIGYFALHQRGQDGVVDHFKDVLTALLPEDSASYFDEN